MSTILITGTTGFVGGALTRSLRDGNRIIELNRGEVDRSTDGITWNYGDSLPASLPTKADVVIHSAADTSESPRDGFVVNAGATSVLLEYARAAGANTFVYISTGSVYGASDGPHQERQPIYPQGAYACTKAAGEFVVQAYQSCFRTLILRLYFPFGPGQRRERLIPRLIDRVSRGEAISIKGRHGPMISPLYIDDLTQWMRLLLESDARGTFNLAGRDCISIRQISEKIGKLIGEQPRFEVQPGEPVNAVGDTTEAERATGYVPRWNLDQALAELATHNRELSGLRRNPNKAA
jgi:nucleoside-diphosphate-sugar epimerase